MINKAMYQLGSEPSAIRELFAYGMKRKAEIGADKVFDFSIGNPSVPAPAEVGEAIGDLIKSSSATVHGYTPAAGDAGVRQALADSINKRFGMQATPDNLYLTAGAAASLSITLTALSNPGDEFIVIAPYFPEYRVWIEQVSCTCVEVPAQKDTFQLDLDAIESALTPQTKGIILNSPNNPVGTVYPEQDIQKLAILLQAKQEEYKSSLFIICDEPYREVVYDGLEVPFIPAFYERTIVCYSYSKSFSLPGERIGYLYVSEKMPEASQVYTALCGAGRALGFVCAPSLFQQVIKRCIDVTPQIEPYAENRALLTEGLSRLGYTYVEPKGAFYLWVRALEPDAEAFSEKAKAHELLLVPSTSFGCDGWVRISYCVAKTTIEQAFPAFEALMTEYNL